MKTLVKNYVLSAGLALVLMSWVCPTRIWAVDVDLPGPAHQDPPAEVLEHAAEAAHETGHDEHAAAGHDAHEQPGLLSVDVGSAFWTIVLFLVLVGVLGKFVWPQILKGLSDRETKIRRDLEDAERAAHQAAETLKEYQAKLAAAQDEARRIIDQGRTDAQKIAAGIKDQTQNEIDQLRQRATNEIRVAKEQAIGELFATTADLATRVAQRVLKQEIKGEAHDRLVQASLAELTSNR